MSWEDQGRQDHGYFGNGTSVQPKATQRHGRASFYDLPGNKMANGQMFDGKAMSAAMLGVPFGTVVTVTSLKDPTKSINVTTTDRGPYAPGRIIDLMRTAFQALFGSTRIGVADVIVVVPAP